MSVNTKKKCKEKSLKFEKMTWQGQIYSFLSSFDYEI